LPASPARSDLTDLLDDLFRAYAEDEASVRLRAMVLGPNLTGTTAGSLLRKAIIERCRDEGIQLAVPPEEPHLIRYAKKLQGPTYNLCSYELRLANECDMIVILPDSPGSFAEFGFFAWYDSGCAKSLVLIDRQHKDGKSFISHGPKRASNQRGATIKYIDYAQVDDAVAAVLQYATKKRALRMDQRARGA